MSWEEFIYDKDVENKYKEVQVFIDLNNKLRSKSNINLNHPLGKVTFIGSKFLNEDELLLLAKSLQFNSFEVKSHSTNDSFIKPNNKLIGSNYPSKAQSIIKAIKNNEYSIKDEVMIVCGESLSSGYYVSQFKESDDFAFKEDIGFRFDKSITKEMRDEFLFKEFKKVVSSFRKEKGCKVQDTFTITVQCSDRFKEIISRFNKQTNTIINFAKGFVGSVTTETVIDGERILIG